MSRALPALRRSLQETLTVDSVHAVVVALLPARGLTVEKIGGGAGRVLGGRRQARGRRVHRHPRPVHLRRGHGRRRHRQRPQPARLPPCPATPTRAPPSPPSPPSCATPSGWSATRACSWSPKAATRTAPTRTWRSCSGPWAASSWSGWTRVRRGKLLGHYGIRVLPSEGFETAERGRRRGGAARLAGGAEDHGPGTAAPAGPGRGAPGHPGRRFAAPQHRPDAQVAGSATARRPWRCSRWHRWGRPAPSAPSKTRCWARWSPSAWPGTP